MERKRTLTFGLLAIAVVVALALVGVAYAWWSETLTINGTVQTGVVNVEFRNASDDDNGIDPGYDKNVADCTESVSEDGNSMTIAITNGYPSYTCTVSYAFSNPGTIPVKLQSVTGNIPPELGVTQTGPGVGDQLDAGQSVTATIAIHVEQGAAQNANYSLTKSFEWVQWNQP